MRMVNLRNIRYVNPAYPYKLRFLLYDAWTSLGASQTKQTSQISNENHNPITMTTFNSKLRNKNKIIAQEPDKQGICDRSKISDIFPRFQFPSFGYFTCIYNPLKFFEKVFGLLGRKKKNKQSHTFNHQTTAFVLKFNGQLPSLLLAKLINNQKKKQKPYSEWEATKA